MGTQTTRRRIFVVDDHEAVREGLRTLLVTSDDMTVVGEASCRADALARIPATRPEVVVLDLHLPDGGGIDACREIRRTMPGIRVLLLTADVDPGVGRASFEAGASGHLVKSARRNEIVTSVRRVADGELLFDSAAVSEPPAADATGPMTDDDRRALLLTEIEETILEHIADGRTNHAIAAQLHLSEKSVKKHISAILVKLEVPTRVGAAVFAARRSLGARTPSGGSLAAGS
jgi:two-component system, NarL family, response regulator DevR